MFLIHNFSTNRKKLNKEPLEWRLEQFWKKKNIFFLLDTKVLPSQEYKLAWKIVEKFAEPQSTGYSKTILFSEYIWKLQQWIIDNYRIFNETKHFKEKADISAFNKSWSPQLDKKKSMGHYKKKESVGECSARINDNFSRVSISKMESQYQRKVIFSLFNTNNINILTSRKSEYTA